jgi:hypothetical protein
MNELESKQRIERSLSRFSQGSLLENGIVLLNTLGYHSERQVTLTPNTLEGLVEIYPPLAGINREKALADDWLSVDILFQLTGDELRETAQGRFIFENLHRVDNQIIESYLFLAIRLKQVEYSRSKLADLTREINKFFKMPVMILFQHGSCLTVSIINRRLNKIDETRDVLEKVTLIKGIQITAPHRAHIEILHDLSLGQLALKLPLSNFVELQHAWEKTLDTSELNTKFYREVAGWYFSAVRTVKFPEGGEKDSEKRNSTSVIRLITRLIFVWFIKEKGLVPEDLFDPRRLKELLNYSDPKKSTYYKAILQNLFFATLNTEMGEGRRFRGKNKNPSGLDAHHGISTVYRYEDYFKNSKAALELFAGIPFLNGGLFECLDKREEKILVDGFSDDPRNQPMVPDVLFFGEEHTEDLSEIYGDARRSHEKVRGLIHIFNNYKFTIEENTPVEEEIALDPELLGKVFENLLAAYNPETGTTARKQTGSFYTPREIVNYMVDEALVAYLETALTPTPLPEGEGQAIQARLRHLLAYNQETHQFSEEEEQRLIAAIDEIKVLDPACGSGAFPMGILHKLVFILSKLDPGNQHWKQRQIDKASEMPDPSVRERVIEDIEKTFNENELDYGRKLYLIENCIYGVDIQPIAVQIAKLRFFISLVVDQKTDPSRPNLGIRPLPNLETKFVAANSLIGIERPQQMMLHNPQIDDKEKELTEVRDALFTARTPATKRKYRDMDKRLRSEIAVLLTNDGWGSAAAAQLAGWDPYDQNASGSFFDPDWMFGITGGFDIVLGNPPYVGQKGNQELFSDMKNDENFEKKMDYWYFFLHKAHCLSNYNGITTFITPHYWVTANGAKKLRNKIVNGYYFIEWINFNNNNVFEAGIHTNVFILRKSEAKNKLVKCTIYNNIYTDDLISHKNSEFHFTVDQNYLYQKWTGFVHFLPQESLRIINKLIQNSFPLCDTSTTGISKEGVTAGKHLTDGICNINQGLVTGKDRHIEDNSNKGVFVVNQTEYNNFNHNDRVRLRPFYKNSDIKRFLISKSPKYYLISVNDIDTEVELKKQASIYAHLSKYKSLLKKRSINGVLESAYKKGKWWALTTDRPNIDFEGEKILCPQRSNINTFAYSNESWYASADVYYITTNKKDYSLKYILAVLNSKLIYYWLYYMGKRKGEMLELYLEPLQFVPIKNISHDKQVPYITLVDRILAAKDADPSEDTSALEGEIDQLIYKLFGLTDEEKRIVENSVVLT